MYSANQYYFKYEEFYVYLFILIRSIYALTVAFYSYYFRLIDDPSKIYKYSLSVSLLTLFFVGCIYLLSINIELLYFFLFQIILIVYFIYVGKRSVLNFKFSKFILYAKEAINYSYPIMINLIMITVITQFGKVYAYNFLSINDMTVLSFIQRISLILVLFHSSLSGFYAKKLFTSNDINVHKKIFRLYFSVISAVSFLIFISLYFSIGLGYLQVDVLLVFVMLLSTFIWCITAYFELYFNRDNKNKYVPLVTLIGFVVFIMVLFFNEIDLDILIFSVLFSNSVSLLFVYIVLKKKVSPL